MAKFGSVEWQNEQRKKILDKLARGEKLTAMDKSFIQIQSEHNRKIKKLKRFA